jgi:acyl-CoA hydrolase
VAYLYGKNLRQRAEALMQIAHPDHRASIELEIFKRFGPKRVKSAVESPLNS